MKKLIVIAGPTASGKTALSVSLAKKLNTVVVSADSRQFYQEMSIGTAKPTVEEMDGVPHYFIDSESIFEELNAAHYAQKAERLLEELFKTHSTIILTGGSGMFIDALCFGLDDIPHDPIIQEELNTLYKEKGLAKLLEELKQKDEEYYNQVDRNNPIRIIRAIEVIRITQKTYSSLRIGKKKEVAFDIHYFVLDLPRSFLYERINLRVDKMIEAGLEAEAKKLYPHKGLKALATVGYTEWFDYFDGKTSKDECIELIKQNSRRYAKRQITWFKRHKDAVWIPYDQTETMLQLILNKSI